MRVIEDSIEVFKLSQSGQTSKKGIAIKDCRGKETLVIVRFGGDVYMTVFDNLNEGHKFDFVMEMTNNNKQNWFQIFKKFVEIKAKLKG